MTTQPLSDEQLAAIQAARNDPERVVEWIANGHVYAGKLLAQINWLRAELAASQAQLSGVWPCICGHLQRQHDYDAVLGRDFCRGCPGDTDLHDYTPEPAKES